MYPLSYIRVRDKLIILITIITITIINSNTNTSAYTNTNTILYSSFIITIIINGSINGNGTPLIVDAFIAVSRQVKGPASY